MELTLREAATLLGLSPRAVRARIARGELKATKRSGRWFLPRDALPLTPDQRRDLQERADDIRAAVDDALPSRAATTRTRRGWSILDLAAFRAGCAVRRAMREADDPTLAPALAALEAGLIALAEGCHQYAPARKLDAWARSRALVAEASARLGFDATTADTATTDAATIDAPQRAWVATLEGEVIGALAGLSRRAERRAGR